MKWWVSILAVLVLVAFGSLSVIYVHTYVETKPRGIILFVANGLDLNLLQKARQQAAARGEVLHIDACNHFASLEVEGFGQLVPDEAAASTALASGRRVQNGYFGQNALQQRQDTLIYAAQRAGRATGLVTTTDLTMPTPAAFYGHGQGFADEPWANAAELIDSGKINVILGGGGRYFSPANVLNEEGRLDGRNLSHEAEKRGYQIVRNVQELEQVSFLRERWIFGLFAPGQFIFSSLREGRTAMPTLATMTRQAIRSLQSPYNLGGYFLVVENGLVATAAKMNLTRPALDEVAELDSAIGVAIQYGGPKALILITNNYNLGALEDYRDEVQDVRPSLIRSPMPFEWLTGPGGVATNPADKAWLQTAHRSGALSSLPGDINYPEPAVHFTFQAEATTGPAWLASQGPGANNFGGFLRNTDIYGRLNDLF